MKRLPARSYIAWGESVAPRCVALTPQRAAWLDDAVRLGGVRDSRAFEQTAVEQIFGRGIRHYFTANSKEALEAIAFGYKGLWQEEVRGMSACILLDRPFPERNPAQPAAASAKKPRTNGGVRARNSSPQPIIPPTGTMFQGSVS